MRDWIPDGVMSGAYALTFTLSDVNEVMMTLLAAMQVAYWAFRIFTHRGGDDE